MKLNINPKKETIKVIQSVKDQKLSQFQLGHLMTFVTRLLKGVESPHELSGKKGLIYF